MIRQNSLSICIIVFTVISTAIVNAQERVDIQVFSNSYTAQGFTDEDLAGRLLLAASKTLTDKVALEFKSSSMQREWVAIKRHENVCLYNKIHSNEREQIAKYSKFPLLAFPPNRLITLKDRNISEQPSLAATIAEHNLVVAVAGGRSYGHEIDKLIKDKPDNFFIVEGLNSRTRLRNMLLTERVVAIIEYWPILSMAISDDELLAKFKVHKIEEAAEFSFGYFICAKSPIGNYVISLFDEVMSTPAYLQEVLKGHKKDMPEQEYQYVESALIEKYKQ